MTPHIILIGFKNAGKSTLGRALAQKLQLSFLDLDEEITKLHQAQTGEKLSPREMMKTHGEEHFRALEHQALEKILQLPHQMVLALGGGTPMLKANQELIKPHCILHVTAPKSIIFERIMINGKPAFFPEGQDAFESFENLWKEREPVFQKLAMLSISNTGSIEDALQNIPDQLFA